MHTKYVPREYLCMGGLIHYLLLKHFPMDSAPPGGCRTGVPKFSPQRPQSSWGFCPTRQKTLPPRKVGSQVKVLSDSQNLLQPSRTGFVHPSINSSKYSKFAKQTHRLGNWILRNNEQLLMASITSFAFDDEDIFSLQRDTTRCYFVGLMSERYGYAYGPWTWPVRGWFWAAWGSQATSWMGPVQTTAHGHQHTTAHHAYLQLDIILSWLLEGTSLMDFEEIPGNRKSVHDILLLNTLFCIRWNHCL